MSAPAGTIAENLEAVRERIARAAQRAGRRPEQVTLVAACKTFPAEAIREAYAAGLRHFGENRVREREAKQPMLADLDATWHLIGHLQSNKARRAARLFHWIDSLDGLSLAQKLDAAVADGSRDASAAAGKGGQRRLWALIEVQLGDEKTKSGVAPSELARLAESVMALPRIELRGLMAVPPLLEDAEEIRPYFRRLRELRDSLAAQLGRELPELSMGMSHDFEAAIEEGATQVRVGTRLFGARRGA